MCSAVLNITFFGTHPTFTYKDKTMHNLSQQRQFVLTHWQDFDLDECSLPVLSCCQENSILTSTSGGDYLSPFVCSWIWGTAVHAWHSSTIAWVNLQSKQMPNPMQSTSRKDEPRSMTFAIGLPCPFLLILDNLSCTAPKRHEGSNWLGPAITIWTHSPQYPLPIPIFNFAPEMFHCLLDIRYICTQQLCNLSQGKKEDL